MPASSQSLEEERSARGKNRKTGGHHLPTLFCRLPWLPVLLDDRPVCPSHPLLRLPLPPPCAPGFISPDSMASVPLSLAPLSVGCLSFPRPTHTPQHLIFSLTHCWVDSEQGAVGIVSFLFLFLSIVQTQYLANSRHTVSLTQE